MKAARSVAALWEFLRPFAILLSVLLAVLVDVIIARTLWDDVNVALIVVICLVVFVPVMIGIYSVLAFPVNALIGAARIEEE